MIGIPIQIIWGGGVQLSSSLRHVLGADEQGACVIALTRADNAG
ncbi:hypothetical protein OCA8868_03019 [Octadecabacter ascidiaceicola]|uniref:Uncharacterized protein n=1 Tax=Octadecabacter ascidiaceicola TaxID=1655543 RepID=A0A238KNU4_9RHOB|nr:hypothetical protein OCA8868_03019 [Octadecabacter ascidiaceicola]